MRSDNFCRLISKFLTEKSLLLQEPLLFGHAFCLEQLLEVLHRLLVLAVEVVVEFGTDHEDAVAVVDHVVLRDAEFVDGPLAVDAVLFLPVDLVVHESAKFGLPHGAEEAFFAVVHHRGLRAGSVVGRRLAREVQDYQVAVPQAPVLHLC
jgi:hypothetical protein